MLNFKKIWIATPLLTMATSRVTESFFDYEYLREFEAKSGTSRKILQGIYEDPISAKTPENPPHCLVPLNSHSLHQPVVDSRLWIYILRMEVLLCPRQTNHQILHCHPINHERTIWRQYMKGGTGDCLTFSTLAGHSLVFSAFWRTFTPLLKNPLIMFVHC